MRCQVQQLLVRRIWIQWQNVSLKVFFTYIAVTSALCSGQERGIIVYFVYLSFNCTVVATTPSLGVPSPKRGYKLVGDNIDIGVKTRYMRLERYENKSLHYFHCYAVQNRIDHSDKPDVHPDACPVPFIELQLYCLHLLMMSCFEMTL